MGHRYDAAVTAPVWTALVVFLVAALGGFTLAAVRLLETWRTVRRFQRALDAALLDASNRLAQVERSADRASATVAKLERVRLRLQRSLAELQVLAGAAGEVGDLVGRAARVVPRK